MIRSADCVTSCLVQGADVNVAVTSEGAFLGYTPLHMAVDYNSPEIVKVLLEYECNVFLVNAAGETALDVSESKGFSGISNMLKKHIQNEGLLGAELNVGPENIGSSGQGQRT